MTQKQLTQETKPEPLPQPHPRTKRKRGGQKGNQNARKHGFYSATLSNEEISEFWSTIAAEGLEPHIALLRIKLRSGLEHDPGNRRVISDASRILAKWYSAKQGLGRTDRTRLKEVIVRILEQYQTGGAGENNG